MSRGFKPVFLPDGRKLDGKVRQTFLRHYSMCPRSAFLSRLHEDDASTAQMVRGTALHEVCARATRLMIDTGEVTIPPDVVKTLTEEVLAELPVPWEEHDYLRECAWRWAGEFSADPSAVVATETLFVLQMGDWQVRARVDFAELLEDGAALYVADYKTARAAPPWEEISRKLSDGRLVPKQLQLILYALVLAYGVPVREEPVCSICGGDEEPPTSNAKCMARGHWFDGAMREIPEPFSVAPRARRFELEFIYPGIENREGKMVRRAMVLDHLELEEYKASLVGLLERLDLSIEMGDWPAVESDAACGECPAPGACPIPQELRNWRGRINTPEQASEAAGVLDRQKAELRAAQTELRNFAKATGDPIVAGDKVWELVYAESEVIENKDALLDAVERAVDYGEPFDRARFVRVKGRTDFKARDLTAEEREQRNGNG